MVYSESDLMTEGPAYSFRLYVRHSQHGDKDQITNPSQGDIDKGLPIGGRGCIKAVLTVLRKAQESGYKIIFVGKETKIDMSMANSSMFKSEYRPIRHRPETLYPVSPEHVEFFSARLEIDDPVYA